MAQVYAPDLSAVAYAARAGAAGQAARENAQLALQQANNDQRLQLQYDSLAQQANERKQSREYEVQDRREARAAEVYLQQQRVEQTRQADERNFEQASALQTDRQQNSWGLNRAKALDDDVSSVQKILAGSQFTPQGKKLAAKRLGELQRIRELNGTAWLKPDEHSAFIGKWLGSVAEDNFDSYRVEEPSPEQHLVQNSIDMRTGKPPVFDSADPPTTLMVRRKDKSGQWVWKPESVAGARTAKSKTSGPQAPADYFADPATYDREAKAARDRLSEFYRTSPDYGGGEKAWTAEEINQEILRHRAQHESFLGILNGSARPPESSGVTAAPGGFDPNVSRAEPLPAAPPAGERPSLPGVPPPPARAATVSAPPTEGITPPPSAAAPTPGPDPMAAAISDSDEATLPFGPGEIKTTKRLALADGTGLPVAPININGRKVRAAYTGGQWRLLQVSPEGGIRPLATLSGPGSGSQDQPIVFNSADADAISAAIPPGTWLRDETGTLFENK